MKEYQKALAQAAKENENGENNYKTIPEALLEVHPLKLYEEMKTILADCEHIQRMVLAEILSLAKDSCYAKDYHLANTHDLESWRQKAKISYYEDYKPYIERDMASESNQLYSSETALYIATTGSTGEMKYFTESNAGNAAKQVIMAVRGMYMSALLPVTLDMEAKNLTISNYASVGQSADGKMIVRASGQTARNMRKKTGTMNILPVEFWEIEGLAAKNRDYMIAVYALSDKRLAKIFCNNLAHFGRILDRIVLEGKEMIEDIRTGHFSVPLSEDVRQILAETFPPNKERADMLQAIIDQKGALITECDDIATIWPNLSMVGCWLSASVGRDAREVLRRLPPKIKGFDLGYGASEGKINIPTKLARASGVAAPFACFYEFLPLSGGEPLGMWEVADGGYYELLITTYSGLYRYNLQDIVKIDGFIECTPNLEFCGKSSEVIYANGQKIYGYQLMEAISLVEKELEMEFTLAQAFSSNEEGYYYILSAWQPFDGHLVKEKLDKITKEHHNMISRGIYIVDKDYKNTIFDNLTRDDRGVCGIKLPAVVDHAPDSHIVEIVY